LEGDTTNIAVLFKGDSTIYNYDSLRYRIDNSRQSRHYVTGLRLSTNYYVSKTNTGSLLDVRISLNSIPNSTIIQTSSAGVLEFHHNSLFTGISFNTPVVENIKCHGGNTGKITVSASGGDNNITYSKDGTNFQTSNIFLNLTADSYTITAKDGAGIRATINVIVTQPPLLTVSANNNSPFCGANTLTVNTTISGGTPPLIYAWNGPNSFTASSQNVSISNATTSNQGIYTIVVTDGNTCTATATTSVIINPIPNSPIVSASQTTVCGVALVTISANGCSDNILWNNGKTTASFVDTVFVNKNYSAVCVNAGGCSSLSSNLLIVTANPTPPVATISADKMRICGTGNVTLTATNCIGQVTWSNNMTGNIITVNLTQTTSFTATCGFRGCASCGSNSLIIEVVGNNLINLVSPMDNYASGTVLRETTHKISATNMIFSPAMVFYKAGQSIDLNAGFQAENGSYFKADIGGCN
jgi:SprB repeat